MSIDFGVNSSSGFLLQRGQAHRQACRQTDTHIHTTDYSTHASGSASVDVAGNKPIQKYHCIDLINVRSPAKLYKI